MERLKLRYDQAEKALAKLHASLQKLENKTYSDYEEFRDSLIQRFEFCSDLLWKVLMLYLKGVLKVQIEYASPRSVFRAAVDAGFISEKEMKKLLDIIEDRNLTSHTYNEDLAEEISEHIPGYYMAMKNILDRVVLT